MRTVQTNSFVSIPSEKVSTGIYRVAGVSQDGKKARLVSDSRMIDKGWMNVRFLVQEQMYDAL